MQCTYAFRAIVASVVLMLETWKGRLKCNIQMEKDENLQKMIQSTHFAYA
jgi:hypothetical protein